jgi:hypothetical protein
MSTTKPVKIERPPEFERERRSVCHRRYRTIRAYAEELFKLRDYRENGRDIGFDYGYIRDAILRKFPTVTMEGPHRGKPTKIAFKEMQAIVSGLNRSGVKLPFRPRRKNKRSAKKDKRA